jgi:hypothetical protein
MSIQRILHLEIQMPLTYAFTYRRRFFPWKKTYQVFGHSYNAETDKMWIQFAKGGREIADWKNCEIFLGQDWLLFAESLETKTPKLVR